MRGARHGGVGGNAQLDPGIEDRLPVCCTAAGRAVGPGLMLASTAPCRLMQRRRGAGHAELLVPSGGRSRRVPAVRRSHALLWPGCRGPRPPPPAGRPMVHREDAVSWDRQSTARRSPRGRCASTRFECAWRRGRPHHYLVAGAGGFHGPHVSQQATRGQPAVQPAPANEVTVTGVDNGVGRVEQHRALDVIGGHERRLRWATVRGWDASRCPISGWGREWCAFSSVGSPGAGHIPEAPLAAGDPGPRTGARRPRRRRPRVGARRSARTPPARGHQAPAA
jgi:hypothetical protein